MSVALNKLNIAIDGLFEGLLRKVFRGKSPLQPIYVQNAVEKAITESTKVFKGGILPPSNIEILMHTEDYHDFLTIQTIYKKHVDETAKNFIESEFSGQTINPAAVTIIFKEDEEQSVKKGCVEVRAYHCETAYEELK